MIENRVELSPSGRAMCRSCKELIAKGVVRFGRAVPDSFSDNGMRLEWHHVECAAKKFPEAVEEALNKFEGEVPNRGELDALMKSASAPHADGTGAGRGGAPTADRAPTSRAKCQQCENPIEKGSVRIGIERDVQGFSGTALSYLHPACARVWVETHFEEGIDAFRKKIELNTSMKLDEIPQF